MVEISDELRCLFNATLERTGDSYSIEVPPNEIHDGSLEPGETYRIAVLPAHTDDESHGQPDSTPPSETTSSGSPTPPLSEGDTRTVTIESVGDQGDGIAKVERGYVVIVPGARPGDEVRIRVENAKRNVAFAEILENVSSDSSF